MHSAQEIKGVLSQDTDLYPNILGTKTFLQKEQLIFKEQCEPIKCFLLVPYEPVKGFLLINNFGRIGPMDDCA